MSYLICAYIVVQTMNSLQNKHNHNLNWYNVSQSFQYRKQTVKKKQDGLTDMECMHSLQQRQTDRHVAYLQGTGKPLINHITGLTVIALSYNYLYNFNSTVQSIVNIGQLVTLQGNIKHKLSAQLWTCSFTPHGDRHHRLTNFTLQLFFRVTHDQI